MRLIDGHHANRKPPRMGSTVGAVGRSPRRAALITFLVGVAVLFAACWFKQEEVEFSFDNRTEFLLCYYPSPEDAVAAPCLQELKAQATTVWVPGCGSGPGVERNRITVILTVKEDGRQIYNRTEECRGWQDSGGTFVIEQHGGEFVVIDPLPEDTPSP